MLSYIPTFLICASVILILGAILQFFIRDITDVHLNRGERWYRQFAFFPPISDTWTANVRTIGQNIFLKRFGFVFLQKGQPQNRKPKTWLKQPMKITLIATSFVGKAIKALNTCVLSMNTVTTTEAHLTNRPQIPLRHSVGRFLFLFSYPSQNYPICSNYAQNTIQLYRRGSFFSKDVFRQNFVGVIVKR